MMTTKGAAIASAVAGLFLTMTPVVATAKKVEKIHCGGVNSCKGKGACHSADNACKGQNACKGKGWIELSEKQCTAKKGTVVPATPMPEKMPDKK